VSPPSSRVSRCGTATFVITSERILIIDDQPSNVRLLQQLLLVEGYADVIGLTDSREALAGLGTTLPDLVLLDLHMPHVDGLEILAAFRAATSGEYLPIVVLTADDSAEAKLRALDAGATDFLTKPFDHVEVVLRIRHMLDARALHVNLESRVAERTRDLEDARLELLHRLALAAEYRDDDTHQHTQRVGQHAAALAVHLGLDERAAELIGAAAPLHDLGKIGVSDLVLLKPGPLTGDEIVQMRAHTRIGARILSESRSDVLCLGEVVARSHHERWDGGGYPEGLAGEAIPLAARIVSVVDVYDALTHARPYKPAWPGAEAVAEIERLSGAAFDPVVVAAFVELVRKGGIAAAAD
jgi:putative two-component system response regulator